MIKFIKENWLLILSLIYVISPIDFIPEIILGPIGIIDDMAIVLPLLASAVYKAWKNSRHDFPDSDEMRKREKVEVKIK